MIDTPWPHPARGFFYAITGSRSKRCVSK